MVPFANQLASLTADGYKMAEAQAKVAHDAILFAMHKSGFKKNCTVKGKRFIRDMTAAKANWLKLPPTKVTAGVLAFLRRMLIG